jgi:hypothetical protein
MNGFEQPNNTHSIDAQHAIAAGKAMMERLRIESPTQPGLRPIPEKTDAERAIDAGVDLMRRAQAESPIQPGLKPETSDLSSSEHEPSQD